MSSILVFSWNTQSIGFCESTSAERIAANRTGIFSTWRQWTCTPLEIWPVIREMISDRQPALVFLAFQEDRSHGSYAHSHLFLDQAEGMPSIGYTLMHRTKLMGLGATTMTTGVGRGLRQSVYVRTDVAPNYSVLGDKEYVTTLTRNKGSSAIYIVGPEGFVIAFINTHFPFNARSIVESKARGPPEMSIYPGRYDNVRENALYHSDSFYRDTLEYLVYQSDTRPDYVIWCGDFNYRIRPLIDNSARKTTEYILFRPESALARLAEFDELRSRFHFGRLPRLKEGIDNRGPTFAPTCKMRQGRQGGLPTSEDYMYGQYKPRSYLGGQVVGDHRVGSFCDRILYGRIPKISEVPEINCIEYNRLDTSTITKSDHAAVYGTYTL